MSEILDVENLSFSFDQKKIFDEVSFKIFSNEIVGIIGPNGIGKTTLFELITGFYRYNSGSIKIGGKEISRLKRQDLAKSISYISQKKYFLSDYLIVEDYILDGLRPHTFLGNFTAKEKKILNAVLKKQNLEEFRKQSINTISGGEYQRCALARALIGNPSLVICDEPVANLDLKYQKDFFKLVQNYAKNNASAFLISLHDINQALAYCTRIILINDMKVIYDGGTTGLSLKDIESVFDVQLEEIKDNNRRTIIYY